MNKNRIWIELDEPIDDDHAKLQCELANKLLNKLAPKMGWFSWNRHRRSYEFGGGMGAITLKDLGWWFDLDYLSADHAVSKTSGGE